jgi:glucose/arabinose dehydrogenase
MKTSYLHGTGFSILILAILPLGAMAQPLATEKAKFRAETVVEGLKNPWAAAFLPDGRILITEREGRLRVVENGELRPDPVSGIPGVWAKGQGGLLDVELHPDFQANGWIYLSYSDPKPEGSMTKIIRGRLKENAFVDQEVIFEAPLSEYTAAGTHFGNRMEFDGKGYLFFTIGDRGDKTVPENNAQKLGNHKGKTFRVHDDGRIPEDNPFAGKAGAVPAIWSYGNRNGQGLRFDQRTGLLWESEHGPRGGDEINIIRKGLNYGWPVVTHGINYSGKPITDKTEAPGMEPPALQWTPSIAVAGIDFYHGNKFPGWKGNLFATALAHQKLVRMEIDAQNKITHQEILLEKSGRIRDIRMPEDGYVYLVYDEPGKLVRLVPAE